MYVKSTSPVSSTLSYADHLTLKIPYGTHLSTIYLVTTQSLFYGCKILKGERRDIWWQGSPSIVIMMMQQHNTSPSAGVAHGGHLSTIPGVVVVGGGHCPLVAVII